MQSIRHAAPRRHLTLAALPLILLLASCGNAERAPSQAQSQRVTLNETSASAFEPIDSPDSDGADWSVSRDGRGIGWGQPGGTPLLTLSCALDEDTGPQLRIIRHVTAPPDAKALFAVLGNGVNARLKLDAKLVGSEWRWEGAYPADDALLDVFTGPRRITATMPGGGMLKIEGSQLPREFIEWCRAGGKVSDALDTTERAVDGTDPTEG